MDILGVLHFFFFKELQNNVDSWGNYFWLFFRKIRSSKRRPFSPLRQDCLTQAQQRYIP